MNFSFDSYWREIRRTLNFDIHFGNFQGDYNQFSIINKDSLNSAVVLSSIIPICNLIMQWIIICFVDSSFWPGFGLPGITDVKLFKINYHKVIIQFIHVHTSVCYISIRIKSMPRLCCSQKYELDPRESWKCPNKNLLYWGRICWRTNMCCDSQQMSRHQGYSRWQVWRKNPSLEFWQFACLWA